MAAFLIKSNIMKLVFTHISKFFLFAYSFIQLLLPCEDNNLRKQALARKAYRVSRFDYLPASVETDLARVLVNEINLLTRLDNLKLNLEVRYDFSVSAAFRTIDRFNEGYLTINNLQSFLRTH